MRNCSSTDRPWRGALPAPMPLSAQPSTGPPGSPEATTTIDGKQLPPSDRTFGGMNATASRSALSHALIRGASATSSPRIGLPPAGGDGQHAGPGAARDSLRLRVVRMSSPRKFAHLGRQVDMAAPPRPSSEGTADPRATSVRDDPSPALSSRGGEAEPGKRDDADGARRCADGGVHGFRVASRPRNDSA